MLIKLSSFLNNNINYVANNNNKNGNVIYNNEIIKDNDLLND